MKTAYTALIAIYIIAGVVTFGISASETNRVCWNTITSIEKPCPSHAHALQGLASGAFWPLYWSWIVASNGRAATAKQALK